MMPISKNVFMFSGQGSQYFQMGKPLYEQNETFRTWMQRMDRIVLVLSRRSVLETLYDPANSKAAVFDRTALTHPAIFMVEYAVAQTLIESGVVPDLVLGSSLGSFAAATIAGRLTMEEALTVVVRQAAMLEERCAPGGMIAVLANPSLHEEDALRSTSVISAINFASHFVLSARREHLNGIEAFLRGRKLTYQRIPVSFAFHSPWIEEIKSDFLALMSLVPLRSHTLPMVCCAHAQAIEAASADHFWSMLRQPIRFKDTIERLEQKGAYRYVDAGPSGTLATMLKYALPNGSQSSMFDIMSPFGQDLAKLATASTRLRSSLSETGTSAIDRIPSLLDRDS